MTVRSLSVISATPFADGKAFGDCGAYELVRARADVRLVPDNAANEAITDVLIVRPRDPHQGNGGLPAVVPNRGMTLGLPFSFDARNFGGTDVLLGDGWLLEQGWTVVWTGWQWDIATGGDLLGCDVPDVVDANGNSLAWSSPRVVACAGQGRARAPQQFR